ncbi:MAG: hypothetical protein ACOH2J_02780 [Allorhizobium sp.]
MQVKTAMEIKTPAPTISYEVVQRLENEWRQMRTAAAPSVQLSVKTITPLK